MVFGFQFFDNLFEYNTSILFLFISFCDIFTEIAGDVVYSQLPEGMDPHTTKLELYDVIEDHMMRVSKQRRAPETAA